MYSNVKQNIKEEMIMAKCCLSCGAVNSDTENRCKRCGRSLGKSHHVSLTPPNYEKENNKLMLSKKVKYGIVFLLLCIVVAFIVRNFCNGGIVGTWKTDEFVSGDYRICNTIKFNSDNTGFFTQQLLHVDEERTYPIEWQEIDGNKYMIICEKHEIVIEISNNEFVIEEAFASADKENIIYHRD